MLNDLNISFWAAAVWRTGGGGGHLDRELVSCPLKLATLWRMVLGPSGRTKCASGGVHTHQDLKEITVFFSRPQGSVIASLPVRTIV